MPYLRRIFESIPSGYLCRKIALTGQIRHNAPTAIIASAGASKLVAEGFVADLTAQGFEYQINLGHESIIHHKML
jgi:hypothetical protein